MTVEVPGRRRPQTHYAIHVYAPKKKPPFDDPTAMSLCPAARTLDEPLTARWQAVTCRTCIAVATTLGLRRNGS